MNNMNNMNNIVRYLTALSLIIGIIADVAYSEDNQAHKDTKNEEFIATKEWQKVEPDQAIPSGLHVKMDLTNGGKWAKLMDDNNEGEPSVSKSVMVGEQAVEPEREISGVLEKNEYIRENLKAALKNIKKEKLEGSVISDDKVREKYRSMDEIKSAFEELNVKKETDFEVMKRRLSDYQNPEAATEEKLLALQDLEYYVHQVDNANDFVKIDGLSIVLQALNSSDSSIKQEAAHVIGSAVQSNPTVQVKTVELGGLPALIRLLSNTKHPIETRKKAIYAISALIRNFPAAQYFFSQSGGFSSLMHLFKERDTEILKLKAISLISDMAVERRDLHHHDHDEEKERQYGLISLSSVVEEMGLCEDLGNMLSTSLHDRRETILIAMKNLHGACKGKTRYLTKAIKMLEEYRTEYRELSRIEEEESEHDSFFHEMLQTTSELIALLKEDNLSNVRTEL